MVLLEVVCLCLLALLAVQVLSWVLAFVMAPFALIGKWLTKEPVEEPAGKMKCAEIEDGRTFKQKMSDAFHGR